MPLEFENLRQADARAGYHQTVMAQKDPSDAAHGATGDSGPLDAEITRLLQQAAAGSIEARARLMEQVYSDLRRMADQRMRDERAAHTLSATALVNETYLRLFRESSAAGVAPTPLARRANFFHAAAAAMRRILIDHARAKLAQKRVSDRSPQGRRIDADVISAAEHSDPGDLLALDEALLRLEEVDARAAEVVRLRYYAGQEFAVIAELLGVALRTAKRDWEFARAWLQQTLEEGGDPDAAG